MARLLRALLLALLAVPHPAGARAHSLVGHVLEATELDQEGSDVLYDHLPSRTLPCVCFDGITSRFGERFLHFLILNDTGDEFTLSVSREGGPEFRVEVWSGQAWEWRDDYFPYPPSSLTLLPRESRGFLVPLTRDRRPVRASTRVTRKADALTEWAWSEVVFLDRY